MPAKSGHLRDIRFRRDAPVETKWAISSGGSGTTLIAAELTGRRARLIELKPRYVDAAIMRWQRKTGGKARGNGKTFDEIAAAQLAGQGAQ